ncbi:hypothetical protein [Streptomyces prasinopilosus]|uniref:hypothetical protein n=1 Tax=Streptomyces prasinopilosus TaxID=67344 RepID=UPI0006EB6E07|nr:hypothetical protein [Streptomyces prasinopilosus]
MRRTSWYAHVRIEKDGKYVEHKGTLDAETVGGRVPTERMMAEQVAEMLLHQAPHLRGGRITACEVRKLA